MSTAGTWLGPSLRRHELLVVGVVGLAAFLARAWNLASASLNHYDEGVYGLTAWGLADPDRPIHPEQRNSPIGLPFLSSLVFRAIGGPSDLAPLWINVALGTLTVLLLWIVVRRWFGAVPAVAAATLLALSEFHIAMSRSGMTDVLFAFLFLAAVPVVSEALQRPGLGTTLAAGLLVGAAWNTKYHGWLAAVIATAGLVPYAWFAGWTRRQYLGALVSGIGLTLIAIACYVPWALKAADLSGGYAALTAYQMQSLSSHLLRNVGRYAGYLWYFEGMLARAAVPAALLAIAVLEPRALRRRWGWSLLAAAVAGVFLGSTISIWVLTACAVPALMRRRDAGAWILLAWGASFLVLAPGYRPYARMVLPLAVATYITAAFTLSRWTEGLSAADDEREPVRPWMVPVTAAVVALVIGLGVWRGDTARWRRSRDLPEAARQIREIVGAGSKVIVIGEAALAFYLEMEGVSAFKGFEYWETVVAEKQPVYVTTGIYIQRAPTLRKNHALLKDRLELLADYPFSPYDNRLLESFLGGPAMAFLRDHQDDYRLRLYRYTPDPSGYVPELAKY